MNDWKWEDIRWFIPLGITTIAVIIDIIVLIRLMQ